MAGTVTQDPVVAPHASFNGGDIFYEVVNGQRVELLPMSAREAVLASLLVELLGHFARTRQLGRVVGETLFNLNPTLGLQRRPDVAFVSSERWPLRRAVPTTNAWDVVPNLAIEVVSKTNLAWELLAKIREYFAAGVQLVWVVYPTEELIYIYESPTRIRVLERSDELDGASVLPDFRLPVSALFEEGNDGA